MLNVINRLNFVTQQRFVTHLKRVKKCLEPFIEIFENKPYVHEMVFQQKVFPIVAFHFMNDEGSNIDLAQENENFLLQLLQPKKLTRNFAQLLDRTRKIIIGDED